MIIWEAKSYREYLKHRLDAQGSRSGLRSAAARAIDVHSTYLSQILSGVADLSVEQAEQMNDFLRHSGEEAETFALMVCRDRAKSTRSRERFDSLLRARKQKELHPGRIVKTTETISKEDAARFYSHYSYAAAHVLSSIPAFQTRKALARALHISPVALEEKLKFLIRVGIIEETNGRLRTGKRHIHIGHEDERVQAHHRNWRLHSLQSLGETDDRDFRYSSCVSLSRSDVERVKLALLENLKANQEVITKSPEEEAWVFAIDFYPYVR